MRLIYIANVRIPTERAHGIQVMKMCEALADVQSPTPPNVALLVPRRLNKLKAEPFAYYGVKQNFKIMRLPCVDTVGFGKFGFFIETISFLAAAKCYLLFKKYDIVYTREQLAGLFFKNIILELHTLPKKIVFFHQYVWRRAQKLVVLTSFIKNLLVGDGIAAEKIIVAPDSVDLKDFDVQITQAQAREALHLPLNKKIVMYAGLFDEWKGYKILLESSQLFDSNTTLVMIGGTPEQVKSLKEKYFDVIFLGYRPYTELPVNQKAADVLVIPNSGKQDISKYYTSPLKVFAHMASGRPIVASDLPSLREVLNEENAVLVAPDDVSALAGGIRRILSDKEFAERIAGQARQDVRQYSWQARTQYILRALSI
jgi:glycosyltransferase involved in cell wall biosynthesis